MIIGKKILSLVKDLGLNVLKYWFSYYAIQKSEDKYDWSFADDLMPLKNPPPLAVVMF